MGNENTALREIGPSHSRLLIYKISELYIHAIECIYDT